MKRFFERLYKGTAEEFYTLLEADLVNERKRFVVTANPEIFVKGEKNVHIADILLNPETTVVADGISVVKGLKILKMPPCHRITGVDIAEQLLKLCNTHEKSVYLLGAKAEVLEAFKGVIKEKYKNLILAGSCDGYVDDKDIAFEEIKALSPDVVLVALGVPAQEELIFKHLSGFSKGIFVGVGGSFDVLSGCKKRAPKLFIKLNLEWAYRIIKEPWRLKRFFNNNVRFIFTLKKRCR